MTNDSQVHAAPMDASAVEDEPMPMGMEVAATNQQEEEREEEEAAAEAQEGTESANEAVAPAAENVEQKQVEQDNQTQD